INKSGVIPQDLEKIAKSLEDTAYIKAFIDEKTQLKNFRYYNEVIAPILRTDNDFCLGMADIDNFKEINASYGNETGDAVIKAVADIIAEFTEDACRYGGEEFVFTARGSI